MSVITLVNRTNDAVEFRLSQGPDQTARLGVASGGQVAVPTTDTWQVQATTTMGDFSLTSNVVAFEGKSALILAQVLIEAGYYEFQIVNAPGTKPLAITLENTWRNPVQFMLTRPGTPVQIVTVVDENNSGEVNTVQQWTVYAIVNGITTPTVMTSDPNATITATMGGDGMCSLAVA